MDLYRYFHPHHNPRLHSTPLRLQELAELEQAAVELTKALKRAQIRSGSAPVENLSEQHFEQVLEAAQFIVDTMSVMTAAHPEDNMKSLKELMKERTTAPGWETWSRLLGQRLEILENSEELTLPPCSPKVENQ